MAFELDPRLAASSLRLGRHGNCQVLLKNNAHFLWLLLIPEVNVSEIHELPEDVYAEVCSRTRSLSAWIKEAFPVDKVNVAAIGNVVSQLHVHIVGRTRNDVAWPGTVWACNEKKPFTEAEIDHIHACYRQAFGNI